MGGRKVGKCRGQLALCLGALALVLLVGGVGFAQEEDEPLVNIMLFETDLREALSEISLQTGVTIIADQTVSGQVTADLQDVPLEKALRMILFTGGLSFRKVDDYYIVGLPDPRNTTFSALVETEIVRLKNVTAQEVTPASDILIYMGAHLAEYTHHLGPAFGAGED